MIIWLRTRWAGFPGSVRDLQSAIAPLKAKNKGHQLNHRGLLGSFGYGIAWVRSLSAPPGFVRLRQRFALIRFPRRSGPFGFRDASPLCSPDRNVIWEF
jgi:hypothetical protein